MQNNRHDASRRGFTMVEVMIAAGLFGLVAAAAIGMYLLCQRMWIATTLNMQVTRDASLALNRMVYGVAGNHGLRAAARVDVITNFWGYRDDDAAGYPLAANSAAHVLEAADAGSPPDGSWRLVVSLLDDNTHWIDYNRAASNLVFWVDTNSAASRQLIGNYVALAEPALTASGPNADNDILTINLMSYNRRGTLAASNSVGTSVKLRNSVWQ